MNTLLAVGVVLRWEHSNHILTVAVALLRTLCVAYNSQRCSKIKYRSVRTYTANVTWEVVPVNEAGVGDGGADL